MELIRVHIGTSAPRGGCVVAIGNCDGVHLGHQALVARARAQAAAHGLASAGMTVEPMPLEFLRPAEAPARLMGLRDKALALAALGVDRLCVARFDERLQRLSPDGFETLLARELGARAVVVGPGFRYARDRAGDLASLVAAGRRHGFAVEVIEPVQVGGARVSSTRVREALAEGALGRAEALIGRPYRITGRVVRGRSLGRRLGFPTANLRLTRGKVPLWGIYAVRAELAGVSYPAVASLGTRPTVEGVEPLLEVHLFDVHEDLYGALLSVRFVAKLRDEVRFANLDLLVAQMGRDADEAREILSATA